MADLNLVVVETDYGWIASTILNSQAVTSNKKRFYDALENPSGEMGDLEKQAFFDGGSYTFFTTSLSKWKSRNSKAATFVMLRDILIKQGFIDEATKLIEELRTRKGIDITNVAASSTSSNKNLGTFGVPRQAENRPHEGSSNNNPENSGVPLQVVNPYQAGTSEDDEEMDLSYLR